MSNFNNHIDGVTKVNSLFTCAIKLYLDKDYYVDSIASKLSKVDISKNIDSKIVLRSSKNKNLKVYLITKSNRYLNEIQFLEVRFDGDHVIGTDKAVYSLENYDPFERNTDSYNDVSDDTNKDSSTDKVNADSTDNTANKHTECNAVNTANAVNANTDHVDKREDTDTEDDLVKLIRFLFSR